MKIKYINSFQEYIQYVESYKNKYYFRGQANHEWNIIPSIFRSPNNLSLMDERAMVQLECKSSNLNPLQAALKLQHYGNPTRLCDLTICNLAALFFAVDGKTQANQDGCVFVIDKTNALHYMDSEIEIITKLLVCDRDESYSETDEIVKIASRNHIIQYNIPFSYTNRRAIMQGGTALVFGFGFENGRIIQRTNVNADSFIIEKIIIPAGIKDEIQQSLHTKGYSSEILYDNIENIKPTTDITFIELSSRLFKTVNFNRLIVDYKISTLYFERETLTKEIDKLYENLYSLFGNNAKIYLDFYYDDEDIGRGNCICRTNSNEHHQFCINWNDFYFIRRIPAINEQASKEEVSERFKTKIEEIMPAYMEIYEASVNEFNSIELAITAIEKHQQFVIKILSEANSIPYCDPETETTNKYAMKFIDDVHWLVSNMMSFYKRGESNKFLQKMLNNIFIEECEKSRNDLLLLL